VLWAQHPSATLIAGGSDLMVYANLRDQRYEALIALDALTELRSFACDEEALHIGASLTLSDLHAHLLQLGAASPSPLLEQLLPLFASRLIRNRATLGGNLATASPIGDAAPVLLALDAELVLLSAAGRRSVPLHAFFTGYRKHVLAPQELILSVHIPRPTPPLQRFYKVSKRVLDDISTVAAAFALELTAAHTVKRLRAAYGGIAATPLRAFGVEQLVQGRAWNRETCSLACAALNELVRAKPIGDHRGSAAYREALVPRLFEKFFVETTEAPT
jgi:xanthine dehydrogenase small subunit